MKTIITKKGTFKVDEILEESNDNFVKLQEQGFGYWFSEIKGNVIYKIYIKQGKTPIKYACTIESIEVIS